MVLTGGYDEEIGSSSAARFFPETGWENHFLP
jgi:hypothetical protein